MEKQPVCQSFDIQGTEQLQGQSFREKFECFGYSINHENNLRVDKVESKSPELEIRNYTTRLEGNRLIKLT